MVVDSLLVLGKIVFSAALGGLVGIEREFDRKLKKNIPMGVRTLILISIFGALSTLMQDVIDISIIIVVGLMGIIVFSSLSYYARYKDTGEKGLTTYTAALVTYFIGLFVGLDEYIIAVMISIITSGILSFGTELRNFANILERKELHSTILFGIIAFVILPILPNKSIDPWNLFNPFEFWILVVLISGLSFASYILLKFYNKGLSIVGLLGGLVSAKTTINELSNKSANNNSLRDSAFNGSILAIVASIISNIVFIVIITGNTGFIISLSPLIIISFVVTFIFFRRDIKDAGHELNLKNPFTFKSALTTAFFIFAFTQITYAINQLINPSLTYITIILMSIASSTAAAASIATLLVNGTLSIELFTQLAFINAIVVILDKFIFLKIGGDKELTKQMIRPLIIWFLMTLTVMLLNPLA